MGLTKLTGFNRFLYVDSDGAIIPAVALDAGADFLTDVARGHIPGTSILGGFGERATIESTVQGEDIWPGTATSVPTPADAGVGMSVVSSSANDGAGTGVGVITLLINFLDPSGNPQSEVVTMNGTTPVDLAERAVRFVQSIHTITVGSNGVAVGDVTIHLTGTASIVYSQVSAGGNMSLTPHRMVPQGKLLVLFRWHASESKGRRLALRLRSTSLGATIYPGVFLFQDAMFLNGSTLEARIARSVPALAIVKISGWGVAGGTSEAACSWTGVLYDA